MAFLVILLILTIVVLFVTAPLRRPEPGSERRGPQRSVPGSELQELQAAREAKYREIRDAELDHQTGKLSDEDFEAVDSSLRAEAAEILRAIDHAQPAVGERSQPDDPRSATIASG